MLQNSSTELCASPVSRGVCPLELATLAPAVYLQGVVGFPQPDPAEATSAAQPQPSWDTPGLGQFKIILQISSSSFAAAMCSAVEPMPFLPARCWLGGHGCPI